jgi:hypothetical protein
MEPDNLVEVHHGQTSFLHPVTVTEVQVFQRRSEKLDRNASGKAGNPFNQPAGIAVEG